MIRQEHIGDSIQLIMSKLVGRAHQRARHIARKLQLQVVGMIADTGCNPVRRTQHPSELLCNTALRPTSTITSLVPISPPCRLARLVRMQQRRMAPSDYWHKLSGRWARKPSVGFGSVAVELKRTWVLSWFWVSSLAAEVAVIPHPPTLFTWSMPRTACSSEESNPSQLRDHAGHRHHIPITASPPWCMPNLKLVSTSTGLSAGARSPSARRRDNHSLPSGT